MYKKLLTRCQNICIIIIMTQCQNIYRKEGNHAKGITGADSSKERRNNQCL